MSRRIKVLIAEPSAIIAVGLERILQESGRYDVLTHLTDAEQIPSKAEQLKPDIVIVNPTILSAGKRNGQRPVLADQLQISLVAIVYQYVEPSVLRLYDAVLDIRESQSRIADMLTEVHAAAHTGKSSSENYELTDRETAVLVLVAKGMMSKEIAEKLNISIHTVISHRKNITRKTGIKSVAGLAVYAMLHNLMDAE